MNLGVIHGRDEKKEGPFVAAEEGWMIGEDDLLLMALLKDPVFASEMCFRDGSNHEYGGCYRVRDHQYPMFRASGNYEGFTTARDTGKTESLKAQGFCHAFKRIGEDMLIGAPELIHLLPLTTAIEDRILDCRITRDFLDTRGNKSGLTHRPFGVDYADGTKIYGRIPRTSGIGFKGMHAVDVRIDEGQDLSEEAWGELLPVVEKHHRDIYGESDFTYHFFGVHSGEYNTGFYKASQSASFRVTNITAIQRPGWSKEEKNIAKAQYGSTQDPDYRRNILGEPGDPASAFFVRARLMACVDQGPPGKLPSDSTYNEHEFVKQELRVEDVDEWKLPLRELLDLPGAYGQVYGGADLGLQSSPTVISVFSHEVVNKVKRLKLIRLYKLHRFRSRQIREALYALGWHFGGSLQAMGIDVTGLGNPIFQELEDDEAIPPRLKKVARGYFFNAKVPVDVDQDFISADEQGRMRDQYGSAVEKETDEWGQERFVTKMAMIEASTRYLREFVDKTFLMLPFEEEIIRDMQGETQQRIRRVAKLSGPSKPQALHILDSMRAMAMGFKAGEVEQALEVEKPKPVLDYAL